MPLTNKQKADVIRRTAKMRAVPKEIRDICKDIVKRSKQGANVDTGRLKRSISFVIDLQGVPTFTEVFYGQFGDNSDLEENINKLMPEGVKWKLIYTDDNGQPFQVIRSSSRGVITTTKATKATTRKSLAIGGIRNFLNRLKNGKKED